MRRDKITEWVIDAVVFLAGVAAAIAALSMLASGGEISYTPAARQGCVVEISECKIAWRPWVDMLSIRCVYRIDEGE